ncbi:MAG: DUF6600 domain-containing protein [Bryobacteraceae bacterium]
MRQIKLFILLIAIPAAFLVAQTDPPGRVGRLSYINGPVSFQPAGVTDWVEADVNRPLTTGDQVWVGDGGRAEIHVGSTALRLDSNTAFQFLNLDDQTTQIQLSQGTVTVRVRNLAQYQNLELDTPSMAFTVLRPGEYRIDADPDSQTTMVTVRGGDGEVTGGGQTFPVRAGQQAIIMGDDQLTYRLVSAPRADGWDQWSSSRDLRDDRSLSARYVSREMVGYQDLDQYGRWGNQPGYGQVWMPTSVSAGWAPYHDGHWAWIAPWGWTWVDDAPWGFAPYHYGRWASFSGRWGWIPGPYGVTPLYAPALVGWIGGGRGGSGFSFSLSFSFGNSAAVGWFPLGPREPYFPAYRVSSGYFGRVNNTNTVINNTTINNYYNESRNSNNAVITNIRYVNQSVPNAVVAVPQDRFANGHRVAESSRSVPAAQLGSARVAVAPEIAPQQTSVLGPRAGEASRAPRPPAKVLSRPVVARTPPPPAPVPFERQQTELKQNPGRPLPAASVQQMRQNAPARSAPVRVVDMGKVERVQPTVGAAPQGGKQPNVPQPPVTERKNVPPGQQRQQQQQDAQRQRNAPLADVVQQPAQGDRVAAPVQPTPQPPDAQQRPSASTPPAVNSRPNESPSNAAGRQNGRWSTPVARPDAPSSNINRRQRNAPLADVVQQPAQSDRVAAPAQPTPLPPDAQQRPGASTPPAVNSRPNESPSNAAGRQNGRWSAPVARPDTPAQPNRPQAQNPQPRPPQQVTPTQVERQQTGSSQKAAKAKAGKRDKAATDKNDEKK